MRKAGKQCFSNLKHTHGAAGICIKECSCQTCTAVILCVSVVDVSALQFFLRDNNGHGRIHVLFLLRQLHIRGTNETLLAVCQSISGIDIMQVFEQNTSDFKNCLADHVDVGVKGVHDQFTFHIVHGCTLKTNNAITTS